MNYSDVVQRKIVSIPQLKKLISIWRFKGQRIVFTNGCFDLLHAGHIHLLTTAGSFGDVLVVGLNTDESVRKLKPGRPLQDEHSRTMIIASLEFVDAVILFNEETPYQLIEAIQPDVLVKGGDYKPEQVVGKDLVEKTNGRVELVKFLEGFSTSGIVSKIRSEK